MRKRNYDGVLNDMIDDAYNLRSTIKEILDDEDMSEDISMAHAIRYIAALGSMIGCLAEASAGLGLSFTALSPLVIGGAIFPSLLVLVSIGIRYYFRDDINEFKKDEGFIEKRVIAALMAFFIPMTVASIAIGVGLAAATDAIFPGIFATWYSVVPGAGIGAITLLAGIATVVLIAEKFAGNLFEYIIPDKYVIGPRVTPVGLESSAKFVYEGNNM